MIFATLSAPVLFVFNQRLAMYSFITETLGPVLILLLMGYFLYRRGMLNEVFIETGSKLVFNLALPALLFLSIAQADFAHAATHV